MSDPHWQYFIAIESDLENIGRYIEIATANFGTYSVELARTLLSAGSEVDVIAKVICDRIDPNRNARNINHYRECILSRYPEFPLFEVTIPRYGVVRLPFKEWANEKNPRWWKGYNDVKHERSRCFTDANLENAIDAVAGLFCLELVYDHNLLEKSPWPKLLHVEEDMMVRMVF